MGAHPITRRSAISFAGVWLGLAVFPAHADGLLSDLLGGGGRANVKSHGAAGDGRTDDRPAFDRALKALGTAGGTLVVPRGTYALSERGNTGACVTIPSNVTLSGEGVLTYRPRQGRSVKLVSVKGRNAGIKGLKFDMSRAPAGQPFAISVLPGSGNVTLSGLRITNNKVRGGIQLLGGSAILVENCQITGMAQNGITLFGRGRGHGPQNVRINNCHIEAYVQPIDVEPTGGARCRGVKITSSTLTSTEGRYAVALSGTDDAEISNCTLTGGLYLTQASGASVHDNLIDCRSGKGEAAVQMTFSAENLIVEANTIYAGQGQMALNVSRGAEQSPRSVKLIDNKIVTRATNVAALRVHDGAGVEVDGNSIEGPADAIGVDVVASQRQITTSLRRNNIRGFGTGVAFRAQGEGALRLVATDNVFVLPSGGRAMYNGGGRVETQRARNRIDS